MARHPKPLPPTVASEIDPAAVQEAGEVLDAASAADHASIQSLEAGRLLGRIELANFYETVSSRVMAETYVALRDRFNEFKGLAYRAADGRTKRVSSLDEFCQDKLGLTQRRCQQLASNLHLLGPELYEQAERIGLRQRDYQAIKALPADKRIAAEEAIKTGDKQALTDLLHDFAESLTLAEKKAQELAESCEAKDAVIAKDSETIVKLREKAARKYKPSADSLARTEEQAAQLQELHEATAAAEPVFMRLATVVAAIEAGDSAAMRGRAAQAVQWIVARMAEVIDEHGIGVDLSAQIGQRPEWLGSAE